MNISSICSKVLRKGIVCVDNEDRMVMEFSSGNIYMLEHIKVLGRRDRVDYMSILRQDDCELFRGRNTVGVFIRVALEASGQLVKICGKNTEVVIKKYENEFNQLVKNETMINYYLKSQGECGVMAEFLETAHCEEDGTFYLVTALCPGEDVFEHTIKRKRQLDERKISNFFRKLTSHLLFLHSKGVAHRDLSSMNVLVSKQGEVHLIDLEMATYLEKGKLTIPLTSTIGTYKYMAPEVFEQRTREYNPFQSDIWSLGMILFLSLAGSELCETPSVTDMRFSYAINGRLADLLGLWDVRLSREAVDLLQQILRNDPKERLSLEAILQHPFIQKHKKTHPRIREASIQAPSDSVCGKAF